ncbi:MAG: hypothetical protein WAT66_14150 [Actinomycetota bacterium]
MNVPFLLAGVLALTAAAVHGIAGERIVVTKLRRETLPSSPFGGASFTMVMIRATWHITTIAFLVTGSALAACTPVASSGACDGIGRISSIAYAGFALLTIGLAMPHLRRARLRHPAPLIFLLVAVLSWWGSVR